MLSEAGGDDVGTVVVAVDPAEEGVRVSFCDGCERIAEGETDRDDRVVAVLDKRLKVRATVFFGDGFKFVDGHAEIGGRFVGATPGGVVERAIAAPARVERDTKVAAVAAVVVVTARCGDQSERQKDRQQQHQTLAHGGFPSRPPVGGELFRLLRPTADRRDFVR